MIIRKYLVDNINEALFRIKQELGDDAYIINQKMVKQPGVRGFFLNKKIEVTVGLANKNNLPSGNYSVNNLQEQSEQQVGFQNMQSSNSKQQFSDSYIQNSYAKNNQSTSMSYYNKLFEEKQRIFNNNFENDRDTNVDLNLPNPNRFNLDGVRDVEKYENLNFEEGKFENLQKDIKAKEESDIKKDLEEIKNILNKLSISPKKSSDCMDRILIKHNICEELCEEIKSKCVLTKEELEDEGIVKSYLRNVFSNVIKIYDKEQFSKLIVVGPTGCGKTTTVAKLAGIFSLTLGKKVGLVNTDTVRIGAAEQLKMYADIMDIPYKYVMNLNDIRTISNEMQNCDTVLIDTVGRGHRNIIQINELNMFIQSMKCDDISLVVNAGMKQQDIDTFMNSFKDLKFTNVIVTKVDETDSLGTFINVCYKTNLPISFITTGQEVPIDIRRANKNEILDMIFGEEKLKIHS